MQRKKLLIGVLAIALCVGIASAALIPYYGQITGIVEVEQAVKLDGEIYTAVFTDTVSGAGTDTLLGDEHYLTNQASDKITVEFVSAPVVEGLDVYPEYKLNAMYHDDAIILDLDSAIIWSGFTGISFDYFIAQDTYEDNTWDVEPWIPQINIRLFDGEEPKYYTSWHSFRTEITGTVGERTSITYLKDDFYFYELPSWQILGLWSDTQWWKTPYVEYYTVPETQAMKDAIDVLTFSEFSQQAGDTSVDPNDISLPDPGGQPYWPAKSQQIVWVGKHVTQADIEGIQVRSNVGATGQAAAIAYVEFRMVYECDAYLAEDTYTITTTIEFVE